MLSSRIFWGVLLLLLAAVGVFHMRSVRPPDTTSLARRSEDPRFRMVILASQGDSRITAAQEAIGYWNRQLVRLGRRLRFDSAVVVDDSVPDALLRATSGEAALGRGPATSRLLASLANAPGDIVIAMSRTDLISFSVRWQPGSRGVVGIRRADIQPLALPNTVRNVIAHELGHVLGLRHNGDSTTLMCGRPASCRPAEFASDSARFFPLTQDDDHRLMSQWP